MIGSKQISEGSPAGTLHLEILRKNEAMHQLFFASLEGGLFYRNVERNDGAVISSAHLTTNFKAEVIRSFISRTGLIRISAAVLYRDGTVSRWDGHKQFLQHDFGAGASKASAASLIHSGRHSAGCRFGQSNIEIETIRASSFDNARGEEP